MKGVILKRTPSPEGENKAMLLFGDVVDYVIVADGKMLLYHEQHGWYDLDITDPRYHTTFGEIFSTMSYYRPMNRLESLVLFGLHTNNIGEFIEAKTESP